MKWTKVQNVPFHLPSDLVLSEQNQRSCVSAKMGDAKSGVDQEIAFEQLFDRFACFFPTVFSELLELSEVFR